MTPTLTYIALGSNQGDRYLELLHALAFIEQLSCGPVQCSPIYESEPVGPSDEPYLNAVATMHWDGSPEYLLEQLKTHEKKRGRNLGAARWTQRPIDLDIIAMQDVVLEHEHLTLPHAEYTKRLFVLLPMRDVCPDWIDPVNSETISVLIARATELKVKKWGDI